MYIYTYVYVHVCVYIYTCVSMAFRHEELALWERQRFYVGKNDPTPAKVRDTWAAKGKANEEGPS